jgi:hypothetical protein
VCFSASAGIDGLTINGSFRQPNPSLCCLTILFLQREANCKRDNTDNNENATKVCKELTSRAFATEVHNLLGFEGSFSL